MVLKLTLAAEPPKRRKRMSKTREARAKTMLDSYNLMGVDFLVNIAVSLLEQRDELEEQIAHIREATE